MYPPFIFVKMDLLAVWCCRFNSDDVATTKAIRRVNEVEDVLLL